MRAAVRDAKERFGRAHESDFLTAAAIFDQYQAEEARGAGPAFIAHHGLSEGCVIEAIAFFSCT